MGRYTALPARNCSRNAGRSVDAPLATSRLRAGIVFPHLTFFTREAMQRLEDETLERCAEILEGRPVLVKSDDPRLRAQKNGVRFGS